MTNPQTIQVVDSWDMTTGIIAELRHELNGLDSGLLIKSQTTGKKWRVKKRILFYHVIDKQKKFTSEATAYTHLSFASAENMLTSAKNTLDKEDQNIFQYQLQSVGQHSKPIAGDTLVTVIEKSLLALAAVIKRLTLSRTVLMTFVMFAFGKMTLFNLPTRIMKVGQIQCRCDKHNIIF